MLDDPERVAVLYPSRGPEADGVPVAPTDWALLMAEAARGLQAGHPAQSEIAAAVAFGAVQLVPGVDAACITVVGRDRSVTTLGATDDVPGQLNAVQQEHGAGPCLSALWDEPVVRLDDVAADPRWPAYARAAGQLGVGSVLSMRLYVQDHVLGALSLYARSTQAFNGESVLAAQAYAAHAAVALDTAEERRNLHLAIDHRDLIGQAKGILMERHRLTDAQAFALLVRTSQNTNTPLRRVVEELTSTGELPIQPGASEAEVAAALRP